MYINLIVYILYLGYPNQDLVKFNKYGFHVGNRYKSFDNFDKFYSQ